jgi:hypothetical protein
MQWEKYRNEFENAKAGAVERGIPVNRRAPAGYAKGADRRLAPDPHAAPVIRELFEMRANGAGPATLAEHLERHGVKTSDGSSSWTHSSIYRLIANPVYKGHVRYGSDDRYVNPNAHEPIVDEVLWQAAQRPPRGLSRVGEKSETLLSGLLRCHACRYAMQGTVTSNGKRVYRCPGRHSIGRCPSPARFYADEIERDVVEAFWSITEDIEAQGSVTDSSDLARLEVEFDRAQARVDQLSTPAAQDALGETYLDTFRARRSARDDAAAALGKARAERAVHDRADLHVETLRGAWERMTVGQRRELLGLRFDCVAASGSRAGERRIVVYPKGTAPADLPRRGFRPSTLSPFPEP